MKAYKSKETPRGHKRSKNSPQKEDIHGALKETQENLHFAFGAFHHSTEEEVIATHLYEIKALRARESYLLRQLEEGCAVKVADSPPSLAQ